MTTRCRAQCAHPRHRLASILRAPLAALALLWLMLVAMPAQAANYTFPGNLPTVCSPGIISGNYNCGALTLNDYDTITIASPKPVTITAGVFKAGAYTSINATGAPSDLAIVSLAAFTTGTNTTLNANVNTTSGVVAIGANSAVRGNINTGLGLVTIGNGSTVTGNINTLAGGAITVGAGNTITGNINTTVGGAIIVGAGNTITGNINTLAGGAISVGDDNTVTGSIKTLIGGAITVGSRSFIVGDIRTLLVLGDIDIKTDSTVTGNIATAIGFIRIGARSTVGIDIQTIAGAITLDDSSRVCYNIYTDLGIINLSTNVKVGHSIKSLIGSAISIDAGSTVGDDIRTLLIATINLTGVKVGSDVSSALGIIKLTDTHIYGKVSTLLRGLLGLLGIDIGVDSTGSTINDKTVVIAPACPSSLIPPSSVAAAFDALETGANTPWSATARKPLYTKLAGAPFTLDIAALKTDGTLESAYVARAAASKYVKLELFDANANVGLACSAYANPIATQTAAFASGSSGRTLSTPFTVPDAYRKLLVRIKECTTSACSAFTSTTPACSSDRFAVRPSSPTLTATGAPVIAAGAPFTLLASMAVRDVNDIKDVKYIVLTQDASKLTPLAPSTVRGTLTPPTLTANAPASATYSEVGYLTIGAGAYRDDDFTAVDSAVDSATGVRIDDCISSTMNDANLADTLSNRVVKYGCSIGNKAISSLGRFKPDHFSTVLEPIAKIEPVATINPGAPMPCPTALVTRIPSLSCPATGFVYSGQPFTVTVTALSLNDTPTLNYSGTLAHDVSLDAWSAAGGSIAATPAGSILSPTAVSAATFVNGVARLEGLAGAANARPAYTFPASPLAAPTDIYLRARENDSDGIKGDGVTSLKAAPALPGSSLEAGITVVSGRIKVHNNYGSELLAVPVKTAVQYWDGTRYVNSTTDYFSSFSAEDVVRSNCRLRTKGKPVNDPSCKIAPADALSPAMNKMTKGTTRFKLAAPDAGDTGSVDLSINSSTSPWLPSTKARIGVGIYKAGPVIYMREHY